MNSRTIISIVCALVLTIVCAKWLRDDERYEKNQEVLLGDSLRAFIVRDSLNAIEKQQLRLTISELEKYRKNDAQIIKELKARGEDVERYTAVGTSTSGSIRTEIREKTKYDTITQTNIIYRDFSYSDRWITAEGHFRKDSLFLKFISRDSLVVVETVTYKRFLGFLWKTKKVKNRSIKVVSKNPNTSILGCEYITVER